MEYPLAADEYYRVGMAFSAAGDFTSALKAFGKGISFYPNHASLQHSNRLVFQRFHGMTRVADKGVTSKGDKVRRAAKMYSGVDSPVNPAALPSYYDAVYSFCLEALKSYADALKLDKDNKHLLDGFRESFLCLYKDWEMRRAAEKGVKRKGYKVRRAAKIYMGVDAPVNPAAMPFYFCQKDYSKALKYYGEALRVDPDNEHRLKGFREAILHINKERATFHPYKRA